MKINLIPKLLEKVPFPGTKGVSIYDVIIYFRTQLKNESINMRASSISFKFFIALFPSLIFLFTIIPYIPIANLQEELFLFFKNFLPTNVYNMVESTLDGIIVKRRLDLMSIGFFASLYFATNGIHALLRAFNPKDDRKFWNRLFVSLLLFFLILCLLIICLSLIIGGNYFLKYLISLDYFQTKWLLNVFLLFRFLIIIILLFTAISIIFYYGPNKGGRWLFYSPGAMLSTILVGLASFGFGFYIDNFGQYNKLYGSIGTIIVLMLWLNINSISLIYGYEFNHAIIKARKKDRTKKQT